MKRFVFFIATACAMATVVNATPVDSNTTRTVAVKFWNAHYPTNAKAITADQAQLVANTGLQYIDVYSIADNGYVVVAADNSVRPVLAYSFERAFPTPMHVSIASWLAEYDAQIARAAELQLPPTAQAAAEWHSLLTDPSPEQPQTLVAVPSMVTTFWNQDAPYNNMCPFDEATNSRTVVGCTATAMAQIMKYWNYPTFGESSHSYNHQTWQEGGAVSYGVIGADFSQTTYLWDNMPNSLLMNTNSRQIDPVALLSYHCGVSVDMQYAPAVYGGSGAFTISYGDANMPCSENAFRNYFKYDPSLHGEMRTLYSDDAWRAMIDADLSEGRPILYTGNDDGGGHAFVLDGSDIEERYHFNWGWGGYGDGFFIIDMLNPGGSGIGGNSTYTFNQDQTALFSLFPRAAEVFDTVEYYDTTCTNNDIYNFYENNIPAVEGSYYLHHLDKVYHTHLSIIPKRYAYFSPNGAEGSRRSITFCPITGVTMPECNYTREGYIFRGWCTQADATDVIYQPGDVAPIRYQTMFYAIWQTPEEMAGIADAIDAKLLAYPNPTTGVLHIDLPEGTATVYNTTGQTVVAEQNIAGGEINLSQLQNGVYILRLRCANAIYNMRIIKQ